MVKPSRGMQPEGVDLKKAGRAAGRAFQDDSFRNYMARKIDLQRKQFGVQVPPPPPPPQESQPTATVSFAVNGDQKVEDKRPRKKRKKMSMMGILQRLKRRHGSSKNLASSGTETIKVSSNIQMALPSDNHLTQLPVSKDDIDGDCDHAVEEDCEKRCAEEGTTAMSSSPCQANTFLESSKPKERPDLFFTGVIVVINGYTHPDAESLQRLLQKHGGDVERYETTRVTHVIAEHLSTAKAKIYAKQRKPIPVVFPTWIMDCVKEQRLLPHGPYLIPEVRDLNQQPSVASFFQKAPPSFTEKETPPLEYEEKDSIVTKSADRPVVTSVHESRDERDHTYPVEPSTAEMKSPPKEHRDKPVAICHFGKSGPDGAELTGKESTSECATINYKAREFGIQKGMFLGRARALCPKLIVLPYDFQGYEEVSEQVSEICHKYAAENFGTVEAVSCDESYMEVYAENAEIVGQLAKDIRRDILETTQCTATIGVAANKFLAKLATDKVKPNSSYVASDYVELLQGLKLRDLHGVGYRSEPKLLENGLETVQDVWSRGDEAENDLQNILGKQMGTKIYNFCKGIDDRPVQAAERKTIGAECNYGVRFDGPYGVEHLIEGLCEEVEKRMEHVGVKGTKVTLKVKQRKEDARPPPKFLGHGSCHNLSKSLDFSRPTRDWNGMSRLCQKMFDEMKVPKDDVRGMGVIMSKLHVDGKEPAGGIRSFFQTREKPETENAVEEKQFADKDSENTGGDLSGILELDLTDNGATASRAIDFIGSDDEEGVCSVILSQNSNDDENREVVMLTQLSAASFEGLEESGRKRNRRSIDSLSDIGFATAKPGRLSIESTGLAMEESERRHKRRSIESTDLAMEDSGRKAVQHSVEPLDLASEDSRTKRVRRVVDTYDDFEIPALSQLAMSQVGFLPTPMRRKVHAKIQEQQAGTETGTVTEKRSRAVSVTAKETAVPRFCQTDVGRMMRLAAVKAGQGEIEQQAEISSTQLERLPLEVQLQVANNDTLSLGKHSPSKKVPRKIVSNGNIRRQTDWKHRFASSRAKQPPPISGTRNILSQKISVKENPEPLVVFAPPLDEQEFFSENILPLSTFLDEHDVLDENLTVVQDFVRQFMDEYSWHEVVLLLRSIRNRSDDWSNDEHFYCIYDKVNSKFKSKTGDDLDFFH
eukprot:scaffold425_cov175-Amphora_coffeaeformis.AAC.76